MFEYITGGYILAGFHEVFYTQATKDAYLKVKQEDEETGKKRVYWRISSTLFSQLRYDVDLTPLKELAHLYNAEEAAKKYPGMTAHEKLMEELRAINLAPKQFYEGEGRGEKNATDEEKAQALALEAQKQASL